MFAVGERKKARCTSVQLQLKSTHQNCRLYSLVQATNVDQAEVGSAAVVRARVHNGLHDCAWWFIGGQFYCAVEVAPVPRTQQSELTRFVPVFDDTANKRELKTSATHLWLGPVKPHMSMMYPLRICGPFCFAHSSSGQWNSQHFSGSCLPSIRTMSALKLSTRVRMCSTSRAGRGPSSSKLRSSSCACLMCVRSFPCSWRCLCG